MIPSSINELNFDFCCLELTYFLFFGTGPKKYTFFLSDPEIPYMISESVNCDKELFHIRRFALNRLNQLEGLGYLLLGPPENEPDRTFCTADATRTALEGGGSR